MMLQPGATHKTEGKKKAKQNKMKANCSHSKAIMHSPWAHTRQLLSWTVFSFIVFLKQTQNKCIKRLMHGCLIEVTTKKTLVGMAKRWL